MCRCSCTHKTARGLRNYAMMSHVSHNWRNQNANCEVDKTICRRCATPYTSFNKHSLVTPRFKKPCTFGDLTGRVAWFSRGAPHDLLRCRCWLHVQLFSYLLNLHHILLCLRGLHRCIHRTDSGMCDSEPTCRMIRRVGTTPPNPSPT